MAITNKIPAVYLYYFEPFFGKKVTQVDYRRMLGVRHHVSRSTSRLILKDAIGLGIARLGGRSGRSTIEFKKLNEL